MRKWEDWLFLAAEKLLLLCIILMIPLGVYKIYKECVAQRQCIEQGGEWKLDYFEMQLIGRTYSRVNHYKCVYEDTRESYVNK